MPTTRNLESKDPQILLNRISKEFPELSWDNFKFLNHGWDHEVITLDDRYAFRFPNSSEYLEIFKNEPDLLKLIASNCVVEVPIYHFVASDGSFGGCTFIKGCELRADLLSKVSKKQQESIVNQLADFLTTLHTIPKSKLKPYYLIPEKFQDDMGKLKCRVEKFLQDTLSDKDYNFALSILHEVEVVHSTNAPLVLVHDDLQGSNILWNDKNDSISIIDFSDRFLGDPAHDFARFFEYGDDFVRQVYEAYSGPKDSNLIKRGSLFYKRLSVELMVASFLTDKISFKKAKAFFDKVKSTKTGKKNINSW